MLELYDIQYETKSELRAATTLDVFDLKVKGHTGLLD